MQKLFSLFAARLFTVTAALPSAAEEPACRPARAFHASAGNRTEPPMEKGKTVCQWALRSPVSFVHI